MPRRLGVMGGTFDPVHLGHLRCAEETVEVMEFDEFLFIPAADPPHKPDKRILPFRHRWQMLELALGDHPTFRLSDLEQRLSGKSYTVNTLRRLREEFSDDAELFFLVGLDSFLELNLWWHYRELFTLARMVVLRRPGYSESEIAGFLHEEISHSYVWDAGSACFRHSSLLPVYLVENTRMEISSTQIRRLAASGRSIRYLVPDEVRYYIKKNCFYEIKEPDVHESS